ncbi:MAG: glycine cleavage system protein GcvH [Deltaproteobacteria bacterium]|nr:MAG: glycine cleavage system protein GcvH [Deltaproteobacteria bacterium]
MAHIPDHLRYTDEHEWVKLSDDLAVVGITDYAQEQLGDVVYVELPSEGDEVMKGEPFGTVESTKAVSELFAPISGTVEKVNHRLEDEPERVNQDPYGKGWMIKIAPSDPSELDELLDAESYEELVEREG